jgi:hypothetical protein
VTVVLTARRSRITHHTSRITHHAPRITYHASCIMHQTPLPSCDLHAFLGEYVVEAVLKHRVLLDELRSYATLNTVRQ